MAAKFFLVACASALLFNAISAWPCGAANAAWPAAAPLGNIGGCGLGNIGPVVPSFAAAGNGGGLGIASSSALAPNGISILSENEIGGYVDITGAVPLLAAVAFEGNLPTAGAAGTTYSCGNGNVGISAESLAAAGLSAGAAPASLGLGAANFGNAVVGAEIAGYNAGLANVATLGLGAANFGNAIVGAEITGLNAGFAAPRLGGAGRGVGNIWY